LNELLKMAGVKPGATEVVLRSVDNYDESHAFEKAMEPTTILAYGMNDVLLPRQHGAPLRAIVPGHYGYKHVKWLTEVEVISGPPHQGYWQQAAGWNQQGKLASTMARIDTVDSPPVKVGGAAKVAGIAFTSLRGVSKVEVSDDGGQTWGVARLKRPIGPLTWRLWAFEWKPTKPGKAKLVVRAYEGDGTPQIAEPRPAHPEGATGYHGFEYDVVP
jgi:DMSO/TMAO reductase YedYZ molybdopterin-dependent catalytic subunit